jgi:hypothetical protein
VLSSGADDGFISLPDIAKCKNRDEPFMVTNSWMRFSKTIENLGTIIQPGF